MDRNLINNLDKMEKNLNSNKKVSFYLLNTKYTISLSNNKINITNSGVNQFKKFNTIDELFNSYYIYGRNLMDYLDDIKIIE